MEVLILRDDAHARVTADTRTSLLSLEWKGQVDSETFRRICIQAYMQVLQYRLRHWMSDSRRLTGIPPQDEAWIKEDLTPRMIKIGLERLAIVSSKSTAYREPMERIIQEGISRSPFPVAFFEEPDQARKWLLERSTSLASGGTEV